MLGADYDVIEPAAKYLFDKYDWNLLDDWRLRWARAWACML